MTALAPAPGAAPLQQMVAAQSVLETRTLLRNGEQLLLTLVIPLLLLAAFSLEPLINFGAGMSRIDFLTPGIIALAVMSTAFTSQAIATGFERRYGVLKRLGATPLSRAGLIAAKTTTVIAVELLQGVLILLVALAIGWRPDASPAAIVVDARAHPARHRGIQRPGPADGRDAPRRGHPGWGQPGLYRDARRGRRRLPADPVPGWGTTGAGTAADRRTVQRAAGGAAAGRFLPGRPRGHPGGLGRRGHHLGGTDIPVGVEDTDRKPPSRIPHLRHSRDEAGRAQLVLPAVMVLVGIVSVQFGAGLADRLFGQVPPAAVTGLRLWTSALAMSVIAGRALPCSLRDLRERRAFGDAAVAISFGLALGVMNFSIYQAFARIPLGVAVTIEFLGPLAVAVAGSRHLRDLVWVVLAAAGVVLLTQGGHGRLNLAGIGFAGLAAVSWAAYIVLSSATGRRFPGSTGLAIAMVVSGILVTPPAVIAGGSAMFRPAVLVTGAAIGILSSVIPYRLELESLRRMPMRLFGVWMSAEPAVAALIGLAMLGQHLTAVEWLAICCVMAACAGAAQH